MLVAATTTLPEAKKALAREKPTATEPSTKTNLPSPLQKSFGYSRKRHRLPTRLEVRLGMKQKDYDRLGKTGILSTKAEYEEYVARYGGEEGLAQIQERLESLALAGGISPEDLEGFMGMHGVAAMRRDFAEVERVSSWGVKNKSTQEWIYVEAMTEALATAISRGSQQNLHSIPEHTGKGSDMLAKFRGHYKLLHPEVERKFDRFVRPNGTQDQVDDYEPAVDLHYGFNGRPLSINRTANRLETSPEDVTGSLAHFARQWRYQSDAEIRRVAAVRNGRRFFWPDEYVVEKGSA